MTPQLRSALESILMRLYKKAKADFEKDPPNRRFKDHLFTDLNVVKDHLKTNRRKFTAIETYGEREIYDLLEVMIKVRDTCNLNEEQMTMTNNMYIELSKEANFEDLKETKAIILRRIRNMLLSQNI